MDDNGTKKHGLTEEGKTVAPVVVAFFEVIKSTLLRRNPRSQPFSRFYLTVSRRLPRL